MSEKTPNEHAAVAFLQLAASGHVDEADARFVGAGFRHHNPFFRGDAESLKAAMRENAAARPEKILEVRRAIEESDFVAVHSRIRQHADDRGAAVVHIFRFDGAKIVELWDVGQAQPEEMVDEHGLF